MPTPPFPNPAPQALVSLQNSMLPGTATAVGLGYLDGDGNVVIVSEDTPLPTAGGGGGGGGGATAANQALQITEAETTNTMLGSVIKTDSVFETDMLVVGGWDSSEQLFSAVEVSEGALNVTIQSAQQAINVRNYPFSSVNSVYEFTSETAQTLGNGPLFVHVPQGEEASLLLLFGGSLIGTVSSTLFSHSVAPGESFNIGAEFNTIEITAVLTATGRAMITSFAGG